MIRSSGRNWRAHALLGWLLGPCVNERLPVLHWALSMFGMLTGRYTASNAARAGGADISRLPHVAAIGDQWPALTARDIYPQALQAFVDGLLTQT
jgi:hypothetical protein